MRVWLWVSIIVLSSSASFAQQDFLTQEEFLQANPGYSAVHYKNFVEVLNRSDADSSLRKSAQKMTDDFRAKNEPKSDPINSAIVPKIEEQNDPDASEERLDETGVQNKDSHESKKSYPEKSTSKKRKNYLLGKKNIQDPGLTEEDENIFNQKKNRFSDGKRVKRKLKTIDDLNRIDHRVYKPRSAEETRLPSSTFIDQKKKTGILGKD